jgi:hypothetical protein
MVLMCKRTGGWTRKLYEIAKLGGYEQGGAGAREVRVVVEGPYGSDPFFHLCFPSSFIFYLHVGVGGPQQTVFSSFSAAVFIVGGSGITFALSAIQDLVQKDLHGASRVKIIELIWIVPDPSCLSPLLPTLSALVQQSAFTPLKICVFYTRAPTGKQPAFFAAASCSPFAASGSTLVRSGSSPSYPPSPHSASPYPQPWQPPPLPYSSAPTQTHFPPGLTLAPGKPRFAKFLEHAISRAVRLEQNKPEGEALGLTGLVVGVCGPVGLVDDVAVAVSGVDSVRRDQVGGVEVHEEVFGF